MSLSLSLSLCSLQRILILFSRMGCGSVSTPWTSWVWAMFGYVCLSWSRNPVSSNSTTTSTCALSSSSCSTPVSPCAPVFFTAVLCCIYCNNSLNKQQICTDLQCSVLYNIQLILFQYRVLVLWQNMFCPDVATVVDWAFKTKYIFTYPVQSTVSLWIRQTFCLMICIFIWCKRVLNVWFIRRWPCVVNGC